MIKFKKYLILIWSIWKIYINLIHFWISFKFNPYLKRIKQSSKSVKIRQKDKIDESEIRISSFCIYNKSSCHHHSNKLFVINVSITVNISFSDHFVDLLVSKFFTQVCHYVTKLSCWNQTISVSVENFECFD